MIKKLYRVFIGILSAIVSLLVATICISIVFTSSPESFFDLMLNLALLCLGIGVIVMFINGFITGYHFDEKFKAKLLADPDMSNEIYAPVLSGKTLIQFAAVRASLYGFCMVFPSWAKKSNSYRAWFNGYDFRKNARMADIIFSYAKAIFVVLMLFFMLMALAVKIASFII